MAPSPAPGEGWALQNANVEAVEFPLQLSKDGYFNRTIITGLAEPDEMKKFILDGTVKEYQLWDPTNMGIVASCIAYEASKGKSFAPGTHFTVPASGS